MSRSSGIEERTDADSDSSKRAWLRKLNLLSFAVVSTLIVCGSTVLLSVAMMRSIDGKPVGAITVWVPLVLLASGVWCGLVGLKRWLG